MKNSFLLSFLIFLSAGVLQGTPLSSPVGKFSKDLNKAAELGDLAKIKSLLKKSEINLNVQDETGMTPLMYASLGGQLETVKFLLSKNVQLELTNNGQETALAFAVTNDQFEVAQELIKAGANVDVTVAGDEGDTLFIRAATADKSTASLILSKDKSLINKANRQGETALFEIARYGTREDLDFLKQQGADLTVKNLKGQSALDVAKKANNHEMIKALSKN